MMGFSQTAARARVKGYKSLSARLKAPKMPLIWVRPYSANAFQKI
jgi:hypothetical protein